MALNLANPALARPEAREAIRRAIDYQAIGRTVLARRSSVHQAFIPRGLFGSLDETPFRFEPVRAKALAAPGFEVAMNVRGSAPSLDLAQALQANLAEAGIRLILRPSDAKQALTRFRERRYDIFLGRWASDTLDPQSDAEAFTLNPDDADDAPRKNLAWRAHFKSPALEAMVREAATETDPARRRAILAELQRRHWAEGPFVVLFQEIEPLAMRRNVGGYVAGPTPDTISYRLVTKTP
jgi:peptide/nickel transport system substrate-binding protein